MTIDPKNLRILHVMAGAGIGGAETFTFDTVVTLAGAGVQQAVLTRSDANGIENVRAAVGADNVYTASFNPIFRWTTDAALRRAIAAFKPDIIHYWMGRAGSFAIRGPWHNIGWYGGYYDRKRFAACDFFNCVSYDLKRHIMEQGVADENVFVVHTVADEVAAQPVARAECGTPDDVPLLLNLARYHWQKALDILIKAMVHVPRAHLWLAGEGDLRQELEQLARDLKVDDRVKFLGWRNDKYNLLAACDIVTFPSRHEPFGTVMIEAWAAKKPLIAGAAQGGKGYVENGVHGLLVEPDNIEALADAINRLIADKDLQASMVANGYEKYRLMFTRAALVRDFLAMAETVLAQPKSGDKSACAAKSCCQRVA